MNHKLTRRMFLQDSTKVATITAATSALGGVHVFGALKSRKN